MSIRQSRRRIPIRMTEAIGLLCYEVMDSSRVITRNRACVVFLIGRKGRLRPPGGTIPVTLMKEQRR